MNMVLSPGGAPAALTPADWLLQVGRLSTDAEELLGGLCELLVARGLPLERVGLHSRLLHPQLAGVRLLWRRGIGAEETLYRYDVAESGAYEKSPLYQVYTTAEIVRRRLTEPPAADDYPILPELRAEGFTDYLVTPLEQASGRRQAVSWATSDPNGFTDAHIAEIVALLPALAACMETRSLRGMLKGLLSIYLGPQAGSRVLAGTIRRGEGEVIAAAIWLCDLRDFTLLSETSPSAEVIQLLNDYFEIMAGPVTDHGGEVLKFIGDAMLAIFPIQDDLDRDRACRTALTAAEEALTRLARSQRRAPRPGRARDRSGAGAPYRHGHLRQYRRARPARLHGDRPGRQPDRAHRRAVPAAQTPVAGFGAFCFALRIGARLTRQA